METFLSKRQNFKNQLVFLKWRKWASTRLLLARRPPLSFIFGPPREKLGAPLLLIDEKHSFDLTPQLCAVCPWCPNHAQDSRPSGPLTPPWVCVWPTKRASARPTATSSMGRPSVRSTAGCKKTVRWWRRYKEMQKCRSETYVDHPEHFWQNYVVKLLRPLANSTPSNTPNLPPHTKQVFTVFFLFCWRSAPGGRSVSEMRKHPG